jgi:hypothetical protein
MKHLVTPGHRAGRITGFCWRLLSQILHRERAHAPVGAGVHCHRL